MAINVLREARVFLEKLNKAQKWIVGGVAAVVVIGIIAIIVTNTKPVETTTLFNNLEITDASKVIDYLKANKIQHEILDGGSTIVVPKERATEIRMAIMTQGLIQDSHVGYELFDKTNLGMSEYIQEVNSSRALESELERIIKSFYEIREVKVHLAISGKQPFAAVKLRFKSGHSLSKISIENIQNIVSSSVEGLSADKVIVTDDNKILSEPPKIKKS